MSIQFTPDTPATRRAFNRLAREKMKLRLLADIRMDLMVCELEGWNKLEYLNELLALVQELKKGGVREMDDKKMTTCPHCGKVVKKGNFCPKCGKKLQKVCNCRLLGKPYQCNFSKCPDMWPFVLLLLHIHQDQKRRKYIFAAPRGEILVYKSLEAVKKLSVDQRSITRPGSFNNDVWYKIY